MFHDICRVQRVPTQAKVKTESNQKKVQEGKKKKQKHKEEFWRRNQFSQPIYVHTYMYICRSYLSMPSTPLKEYLVAHIRTTPASTQKTTTPNNPCHRHRPFLGPGADVAVGT